MTIKSNRNLRKLLQDRLGKNNPRRKLTTEETKRLAKLEVISEKLKRRENVQNRKLKNWLTDDEYATIDAEWQEQLALREELKGSQNPDRGMAHSLQHR